MSIKFRNLSFNFVDKRLIFDLFYSLMSKKVFIKFFKKGKKCGSELKKYFYHFGVKKIVLSTEINSFLIIIFIVLMKWFFFSFIMKNVLKRLFFILIEVDTVLFWLIYNKLYDFVLFVKFAFLRFEEKRLGTIDHLFKVIFEFGDFD